MFVLSLLLQRLEPMLREAAGVASWQVRLLLLSANLLTPLPIVLQGTKCSMTSSSEHESCSGVAICLGILLQHAVCLVVPAQPQGCLL